MCVTRAPSDPRAPPKVSAPRGPRALLVEPLPRQRRNLASQCKPILGILDGPWTQRRDDDDESQTKKNLPNQKKENLPRVSACPANEFGVWVQLSQIQLSSAIQPSRESPPHARSSAPCWPWDGRRYLEEGSDDASRRRGPGARRRRPDPSGRGARATSFRSVPGLGRGARRRRRGGRGRRAPPPRPGGTRCARARPPLHPR